MGKKSKPQIIKIYEHNGNTFKFIQQHEDTHFYEYTVTVNGKVALRTINFDEEQYSYAEYFYDGAVQSYKILNGVI